MGVQKGIVNYYKQQIPYPLDQKHISGGEKSDSWIYVLLNKDTMKFKIGHAVAPIARCAHIKNVSGCDVAVAIAVCLQRGYDEDEAVVEKFLHRYFRAKRGIGEWFNLNFRDLVEIRHLFWEHIEGEDIIDNLKELAQEIKSAK